MKIKRDLESFYNKLEYHDVKSLKNIYNDNVTFIDPIHQYRGLSELEGYFSRLLKDCQHCRCLLNQFDVIDGKGWINWTMFFSHQSLKKGAPLSMDGISYILIEDNKISYQRDYYDLGSMLYEHLPLIGPLIRYIRRRLAR